MARIKLSPLISSINGKLGNAVFQGGKSGIILREKVKPRNPRTQSQSLARNRLASVKALWQDLTSDEKNSWISLSTFYKRSTKHNTTKFLSAYELFVQSNTIRLQGTFDPLLTTSLELLSVDEVQFNMFRRAGDVLEAELEIGTSGDVEYRVLYASRPHRQSASISKSEVRFMKIALNDASFLDITNEYFKVFNTLPNVNDKVLMKAIGFNLGSGWSSKASFEEVIVTFL